MIDLELEEVIAECSQMCQIKVDRVNFKDAKNAYYARTRVQKLYDEEEYSLQIDSHMRMVKGWDTLLKDYLS